METSQQKSKGIRLRRNNLSTEKGGCVPLGDFKPLHLNYVENCPLSVVYLMTYATFQELVFEGFLM